MKKILLCIVCLFLLTGCADYQELSEINIINGIAIDYKDDEYVVSFEIIKNEASENNNEVTSKVITAQDSNLALAFNEAIKDSNKEAYFKHVHLLIISEELAKNGIEEVVDYMLRNVKMSTTFYTVITEDPNSLLKIELDDDTVSNYIVDLISSNLDTADLNNIDIIVSTILNKRKDIGLPYIEIEEEDKITLHQIAYFHEAQMKDVIDAKMYNFLYLNKTYIDFLSDETVLNIYKKKIDYEVKKDKVIIKVSGRGNVKAISPSIDLEKYKSYKEVEEIMNKEIKEEIESFLEETLNNDSDLTGIKDKYYKKYREEKENVPYEVDVNIALSKNGSIYEVIQ